VICVACCELSLGTCLTLLVCVCRVYNGGYPHLLAEMYAYSMAAAHLRLPHLQLQQHMISNVDSPSEGWPFVDSLTHPCTLPDAHGQFFPALPMPTFLHYCQSASLGKRTGSAVWCADRQ
jgi:hypothetical protein